MKKINWYKKFNKKNPRGKEPRGKEFYFHRSLSS
jgi:hypothetical protein